MFRLTNDQQSAAPEEIVHGSLGHGLASISHFNRILA